MITPKKITINAPFIGISDPPQYLGVKLNNFSTSQLFYIKDTNQDNKKENSLKQELTEIRDKIYLSIIDNINDLKNPKDIEEGIKTNDYFNVYDDFVLKTRFRRDRQRLVVRITRITPRETRISTLCRFYTSGNNLYLVVDSYLLGQLNILSLVINTILLISILPLFFSGVLYFLGSLVFLLSNLSTSLEVKTLFLLLFLPAISPIIPGFYLYKTWVPVLKSLLNKENFLSALKHKFHNRNFSNLFDEDDGLTYLKTVVPYILEQAENTLRDCGITDNNIFNKFDELKKAILSQPKIAVNNQGSIFGLQIGDNNNQQNT